ncbi:hypothetical protein [Roseivirga pacifica]|uniref:hypothetical protein n=1 Tax=Roseivirga pacifica TaxID=1267423 RepID=UPI000B7EF3F0|nr:hypothetical protein [Roseivirga pacifica]
MRQIAKTVALDSSRGFYITRGTLKTINSWGEQLFQLQLSLKLSERLKTAPAPIFFDHSAFSKSFDLA